MLFVLQSKKNLPSNVAQQIIKSGLGQTKIITTTYILACNIIVTSHIAPKYCMRQKNQDNVFVRIH